MDLQKELKILAKQIENEIILRLHSPIGVNPRAGRNTLIGSELERSIKVDAVSDEMIVFQIADYYEYIVRGWKRTGRFPGTSQQFIKNITDWVRRKHIRLGNMTQNQIVFYLYKRMLIDGREIAPRPLINYDENDDVSKILPFLDDFFDKWSDWVFEKIMYDIDKFFNQ